MTDYSELLGRLRTSIADTRYPMTPRAKDIGGACDAIETLTRELAQMKRDPQRLLWKDEASTVCPSVEMCFEYGETVRCGPCGIKLAALAGVEEVQGLPNLPQVSRLNRELASERTRLQHESALTNARDTEIAELKTELTDTKARLAEAVGLMGKLLGLLDDVSPLDEVNYARDDWQDVLDAQAFLAKQEG